MGTRLVEHACQQCVSWQKSIIALDVRESNQDARKFFSDNGFRERMLIRRPSDQLLGRGSTIRMERGVSSSTA